MKSNSSESKSSVERSKCQGTSSGSLLKLRRPPIGPKSVAGSSIAPSSPRYLTRFAHSSVPIPSGPVSSACAKRPGSGRPATNICIVSAGIGRSDKMIVCVPSGKVKNELQPLSPSGIIESRSSTYQFTNRPAVSNASRRSGSSKKPYES